VLIQSSGATAGDPSFRAVTVDVQRRLAALPHTQNFESPLAPANANQISADGHSALLRFQIAGNDTEAKIVQRLVTQMERVGADVGLDKLPPDQAAAFRAAYSDALRPHYPRRPDGTTLLPFKRFFFIARI